MKAYIENFKKYRFLLWELVKKGVKLKYRRSYLGILWTLLEPLMTMIVLSVVFGTLFGNKDPHFPVYILCGRLMYSFFSSATNGAMKAIRTNAGMIKKVYVPKYIYPLSSVLFNYIIFAISLIVLVVVSIVLKVYPTIYLAQAIIPLILLLITAFGVGMILSTMAVFFRDLEYLWSVGLMIIMYASAIFYKPEKLLKSARLHRPHSGNECDGRRFHQPVRPVRRPRQELRDARGAGPRRLRLRNRRLHHLAPLPGQRQAVVPPSA